MLLTVHPADPVITPNPDGTGYTSHSAYSGHHVQLDIGNVSIAFDDRNFWTCPDNETCSGVILQFAEYHDDPVRLCNASMDPYPDDTSCAERIMRTLAADLGFTVNRNN